MPQDFRVPGGAQSYRARAEDADDIDFSTGSVGLGVSQTLFSSILQDFVVEHGLLMGRDVGPLTVKKGDWLSAGWWAEQEARDHGTSGARADIKRRSAIVSRDATLITVIDVYPATVAWVDGVDGHQAPDLGS